MRRLAIVDPIGGHQPVTNEDGTVQVVYNGECYNYRELRAELTTAGHRFTSNTDTEVIAHGYEAWGIEGLARRLNGIFAFCVWDARTRTAFPDEILEVGLEALGVVTARRELGKVKPSRHAEQR